MFDSAPGLGLIIMIISLCVLGVMAFLFSSKRHCFSICFVWDGVLPRFQISHGRDYSGVWTTKAGKNELERRV